MPKRIELTDEQFLPILIEQYKLIQEKKCEFNRSIRDKIVSQVEHFQKVGIISADLQIMRKEPLVIDHATKQILV